MNRATKEGITKAKGARSEKCSSPNENRVKGVEGELLVMWRVRSAKEDGETAAAWGVGGCPEIKQQLENS